MTEKDRQKDELYSDLTLEDGIGHPAYLQSDPCYPLSHAQRRLWFLFRLDSVNTAYTLPCCLRFSGDLHAEALRKAFMGIITRHEALRTIFFDKDGESWQSISPPWDFQLPIIHISESEEQKDTWFDRASSFFLQPFDLRVGPPIRCLLIQFNESENILAIAIHHIVADGWSLDILLKELAELYSAEIESRQPVLVPVKHHFGEYVSQLTEDMERESFSAKVNARIEALRGTVTSLPLPIDRPRPARGSSSGAVEPFQFSEGFEEEFISFCRTNGTTPFIVSLAAFGSLLHCYTHEEDFLIGTPMACRNRKNMEHVVGFFVNTVPIRLNASGDPSFTEFFKRTHHAVMDAMDHQETPLDLLIQGLRPERTLDRSPLIQVMMSMQNVINIPPTFSGLKTEFVSPPRHVSMFDLTMDILYDGKRASGLIEYNTDIFERSSLIRLSRHFTRIMHEAIHSPDKKLSELPFLENEERELLFQYFTSSHSITPPSLRIHERISLLASQNPNAAALVTPSGIMTRAELESRSNQLAYFLQKKGMTPGNHVGICLRRNSDAVPAILSVMKAGGVFVPLDPDTPPERLGHCIRDGSLTWTIVNGDSELIHQSNMEFNIPIIDLKADTEAIAAQPVSPLTGQIQFDNNAYIIYTSGTTGIPKGVVVTHQSLEIHCAGFIQTFNLSPEDRILQFAPIYFDAALDQIFPYLTAGASVAFRDNILWTIREFLEKIESMGITVADIPPLYLKELLDHCTVVNGLIPKRLRMMIAGGESLPTATAKAWLESPCQNIPLVNVYGPTEGVITATYHRIESETDIRSSTAITPIGKPLPGRTIRILDEKGNLVPLGIPGELCLGGPCQAAGYWNHPDLTSQRFTFWREENGYGQWLDHAKENSIRLYRTGDRVRMREDGVIEFLGRLDKQIKLRGFRIEPGDIESVLCSHPHVKQAAIVAWEESPTEKSLVAYIVFHDDEQRDTRELLQWCRDKLPSYMIPSHIMILPSIPTTRSGKLDESSLSKPVRKPPSFEKQSYTEMEEKIASAWAEVLGVPSVGKQDNFFDLGGHSLLLIRLHSLLTQIFHFELNLVDLFQYPTVATLAHYLEYGSSQNRHKPTQHLLRGEIAIIGMAGRFPGAANVDEFWENLIVGKESIRFFTRDELLNAGVNPSLLDHPDYVMANGVLDNPTRFDADFFGYTPREAEIMDPQQRIFLEESWHVLEHAGYDPFRYPGRIGVFAGVGMNTYILRNLLPAGLLDDSLSGYQVSLYNEKDFVPLRVSYRLNLHGPSVNINTACSSSLVAVHEACKSLLAGECDMAVAGGVSIHFPQSAGYLYQKDGIASPDGHCRAFAEDAAGTVGGNGTALVLLKPLQKALDDGDTIHAIIKGSSINNDGNQKVGFTAPSIEGQSNAISSAIEMAGISPETIRYVETHGTGTSLGDPIEIKALTQAYQKYTDKVGFCAIGSVKTNLGHMDTAAGTAGLIKAILSVKYGLIPASLHCEKPNSAIGFENTPFYVNNQLQSWVTQDSPRRAGVSSFGMGGTNVHVILEQPSEIILEDYSKSPCLLVLSARSQNALHEIAKRLADYLEKNPQIDLADVSYTLAMGRTLFEHRAAVICENTASAVNALRNLGSPISESGIDPQVLSWKNAWMEGETPDWFAYFEGQRRRRIPLPGYPFEGRNYWIEPPTPTSKISSPKQTEENDRRNEISDWFYVPSWTRRPLNDRSRGKTSPSALIFHSGSQEENRIIDWLSRNGLNAKAIHCIPKSGASSDRTISLESVDEIRRLLISLKERNSFPQSVLYTIPIVPFSSLSMDIRQQKSRLYCYTCLLNLTRALASESEEKPVRILIASSELADVSYADTLVPEKHFLFGPIRVIPQEYPNLTCQVIDLPNDSNRQLDERHLALLGEEILSESNEPFVALRGWRWTPTLESMALGTVKNRKRFRTGGVYLITGGLGGMGLTFARHLTKTLRAKLILVSRNHPPEDIKKQLREMESSGSTIMTASADVANLEAMRDVIHRAKERFGIIHGVIHAAGVPGGSLIARGDEDEAARVMRPKVDGVRILEEIFKEDDLDFMVLCSSLTGRLGGIGQSSYCAANAFLDGYAISKSSRGKWPVVSIAWDSWKEVGMAARAIQGEYFPGKPTRAQPGENVLSFQIRANEYWPLNEHRLDGRMILPGASYLDLVWKAFSRPNKHLRIEKFVLQIPLVPEENNTLILQVTAEKKSENRLSFLVSSSSNGISTIHAQGEVSIEEPPTLERDNIEVIKSRCPNCVKESSLLGENQSPIQAGPRWQTHNEYWLGNHEGIATIELSADFIPDCEEHPLHPALVDRATSFLVGSMPGKADFFPIGYDGVAIYESLPARIISHVQLNESESTADSLCFTIRIMNSDGKILADIKRYTLIRISSNKPDSKQGLERTSISPLAARIERLGIAPPEGAEALERILERTTLDEALVYVCPTNLESEIKQSSTMGISAFDPQQIESGSTRKNPRPAMKTEFRLPEGPIEETVATVWSELLGIDGIGADDDLFDLGADSLVAVQAASRLREHFQANVSLDHFFETPNVAGLARLIASQSKGKNTIQSSSAPSESEEEWEEGEI